MRKESKKSKKHSNDGKGDRQSKSRKSSCEEELEVTFKKCPSTYKNASRKSSWEEDAAKRNVSPLPREEASGSEAAQKKLSPDHRNQEERKSSAESRKVAKASKEEPQRKMSPSSKDKRVSFEAKDEDKREDKKEEIGSKDRDDSLLPPPDFEENYLIAQSDILRQASIEYDRRMQEHREMLRKLRKEQHFDESAKPEFPDFEKWMEEREKEESRKSSTEKSLESDHEGKDAPGNLRNQALLELSFESSFDGKEEGAKRIVVTADVERPPEEEGFSEREKEVYAKLRGLIIEEYLLQSQESLREFDINSAKQLLIETDERKELIKQDSMKEMRRSLERKWLENSASKESAKEGKTDRRRRSEEKTPVTGKVEDKHRRSFSFDEEILI